MTTPGRRRRPEMRGQLSELGAPSPWEVIKAAAAPTANLSPFERLALVAVYAHVGYEALAWPSLSRVARCIGAGERSARQAVQNLVAMGIFRVAENVPGRPRVLGLNRELISALASGSAAPRAADPGTTCRRPRHHVPHSAAPRADEVVAPRSNHSEEACPEGAPPLATLSSRRIVATDHDLDPDELIAEARRTLPPGFAHAVDLAAKAYSRTRNAPLLAEVLQRLKTEVH